MRSHINQVAAVMHCQGDILTDELSQMDLCERQTLHAIDTAIEGPSALCPLEIDRNDALITLHKRENIRRQYAILPLPICFLILYVITMWMHNPIRDSFLVETALKETLVTEGSGVVNKDTPVKFQNIGSFDDFFSWSSDTFAPATFITKDYNNKPLKPHQLKRIAYFNVIIGAIRLEQVAATNSSCTGGKILMTAYPYCYDLSSTYSKKSVHIDSDINITEAKLEFLELKQKKWVDENMVSLVIVIPTYNGELKLFGITTLKLTLERGGMLRPSSRIVTIPADPYGSRTAIVLDVIFLFFYGIMVLIELREVTQSFESMRLQMYLSDFWNLLDIAAITLIATTYAIWYDITKTVYNTGLLGNLSSVIGGNTNLANSITAQDHLQLLTSEFGLLSEKMVLFRLFGMGSILALAIRILKHFRFQPKLAILTRTISKSVADFLPFLVVFLIMFFSYAVCGCFIFGSHMKEYSTLFRSAVSCMNLLFGIDDFATMKSVNFTLAVFYYWSYMIILFLILFNILLAIVLDAYTYVKNATAKEGDKMERDFLEILHDNCAAAVSTWEKFKSIFRKQKIKTEGRNTKRKRISTHEVHRALRHGSLKGLKSVSAEDLKSKLGISSKAAEEFMLHLKEDMTQPEGEIDLQTLNIELQTMKEKLDKVEDKMDYIVSFIEKLKQ